MNRFFLKVFDFFVFSSLYIALCAVLMIHQTSQLLHLQYNREIYMLFAFFATFCSYNFHWYLTPHAQSDKIREQWTEKHRHLNFIFFVLGLVTCFVLFFFLLQHWWALLIASVLTFLYSAPKIPLSPFVHLKKVAIGKTIFLSFVWMYATTLLPIFISGKSLQAQDILFCMSRFFLIYAICILFDYRDREDDRKEGIRSMITYFDESGINKLFYFSLIVFAATSILLHRTGFDARVIVSLLIPGLLLLLLYRRAKTNFSDYLYYFVLDGLMMLSAIFTLFLPV